jgi:DNA invertase Pin-like site-specific DNA recombinase
VSTVLPGERGDGKIQGWHRDRLAVIYVRQSSRQQVADHGESTRLQYGLTGRAAALGWAASRVMVIDEDLGRSAANAAERPGFARLVAEITMGHVGLVLGLEMSRLARAGRDWHQLIELCSLAGALLADADGVYDPNWYNDRLLLGLKGTMSEVELHLIRQRMASGRLAKAGRGELAVPLPAGYARQPSGEVALDPDEQVQAVIRLVFRLFDELGTVHAVLRFLVEHQVQIGMRERSGPGKGEVAWRAPHQQGLSNMLRNPAYAGIYAYGRSRTDRSRRLPGREHSGRVRGLDTGQWLVRIDGALPAYISVEQYERNLARMAANRARAESLGAPREGPALLGGLVACGICGHRMQVSYEASGQGLTGRYCCQRRHHTYGASRWPPVSWTIMSSRRCCRRWPRLHSSCRSPPRRRSRPAGPRSAGSGGSGWSARTSSVTGRGASTSSPSRRTAWWPASSSASGKPRWPSGRTWARSTSGTSGPVRPGCRPPS